MDLFTFMSINILTELEIKIIIRNITEGLEYCHNNNVIHFDLKLENILIDCDKLVFEDTKIVICDFGLSEKYTDTYVPCKEKGSLFYLAPELILKKKKYTKKIDIWALGIIAMILSEKYYPFLDDISNNKLHELIKKGDFYIYLDTNLNNFINSCKKSLLFKSFILATMSRNSNKRPNATDLLKFKWFTEEY